MSPLPAVTQIRPPAPKDPVADSTGRYAFRCPDQPDSVALIASYIPPQGPVGGPGCYSFGDEVRYEIHVDNDGDGAADLSYQFRFRTSVFRTADSASRPQGRADRSRVWPCRANEP